MPYSHDKKTAKGFADEAFAAMARHDLPATPDIFEVWYAYQAGENYDVRRAVDLLISTNKLTPETCRDIHVRFLSSEQDGEIVRRAGDQVTTTLKNVSGIVGEMKAATSSFGTKLTTISSRADGIRDAKDLRVVLNDMIANTDKMLEHNRALETTLDRSSSVMAELQRDLDLIKLEAMTDGLTGLANRKCFDIALRKAAQDAKEKGAIFSLLMIDIDHFKAFNDNFGHQVGDQVLRLVARTLTDGIKGRDIVARYGGEEFSIILPETPLHLGVHVANALRASVATKNVVNRNTNEKLGRITMSVGVAEFTEIENLTELLERADAALYTAKHNGRNQIAASPTPVPVKA